MKIEIPDIDNLTANTTLNAKINLKNEIPSINKLATTAALNTKINRSKAKT